MEQHKITPEFIQALKPVYDVYTGLTPSGIQYLANPLTPGSSFSLLEFADLVRFPTSEKLWILLRKPFITQEQQFLFSVDCARRMFDFFKVTDDEALNALDTIEAFEFDGSRSTEYIKKISEKYKVLWLEHDSHEVRSIAWCIMWAADSCYSWFDIGYVAGVNCEVALHFLQNKKLPDLVKTELEAQLNFIKKFLQPAT